MASSKRPFKDDSATKILLTEGINDCHVISALCHKHKVPQSFSLFEAGSDDQAIRKLNSLAENEGVSQKQAIGIVIDADNPNLVAKWQKITKKLTARGYTLPNNPELSGTIIKADDMPDIGIWLMPDNDKDGMLEDFCHRLIEPESLEVAQQSVEQAKQQNITTFKDVHRSKAIIHTYLAWQDEPGLPLGAAITAKALDGDKPLAKNFVNFLTKLFIKED